MAKQSSNESNVALLDALIQNWEDETVEFKEASNDFDTDKIGRYVSALSNEANLADVSSGWLVLGVRNKTREVVGTNYRTDPKRLDGLRRQVNEGADPTRPFEVFGWSTIRTAVSSCWRFRRLRRACLLHGKGIGTPAQARTSPISPSTNSMQFEARDTFLIGRSRSWRTPMSRIFPERRSWWLAGHSPSATHLAYRPRRSSRGATSSFSGMSAS